MPKRINGSPHGWQLQTIKNKGEARWQAQEPKVIGTHYNWLLPEVTNLSKGIVGVLSDYFTQA